MGGAIKVPGNITRTAEFNIYSDPLAAKIVFESGLKNITLIPLDVTRQVVLTPQLIKKINKNTKVGKFVYDILEFYINFCITESGLKGAPLHDPLTVGEVINPSFMKKIPLNVRVVTKSELFNSNRESYDPQKELIKGQTVAELRKGKSIAHVEPNMQVCLEVNYRSFLKYFVNIINS
ncbi:MAG: Inosine-uridine preferring nucleoside hydrolase [Promethearchaeota archaeon]|nr:MAG: Inosine-uridine preferring nucleoside hydrolase [Candidatus Lokiarchaeota archaeon]